MKKKMPNNSANFIPELWSKKFLSKFFDQTMFPLEPDARSFLMKNLTAEIKRLFETGLTPEQIAEKIDPEMFEQTNNSAFIPWKTWHVNPDPKPTDKITNLRAVYGLKVIKPGGYGILGTTS